MANHALNPVLAELRERIGQLEGGPQRARQVLPFGVAEVDQVLPGGGLAFGALHEVAGGGGGTVDGAAAALFVAGIAARSRGKVLWCMTRPDLFFPAVAQAGLHPDRVVFCESDREEEALSAMEEGLSFGGLAAVVGELVRLPMNASRRLQLAAEKTGAMGIVLIDPTSLTIVADGDPRINVGAGDLADLILAGGDPPEQAFLGAGTVGGITGNLTLQASSTLTVASAKRARTWSVKFAACSAMGRGVL